METPIEQLIENLRLIKNDTLNKIKTAANNGENTTGADGEFIGLMISIKQAEKLLETEKHAIKDAFNQGFRYGEAGDGTTNQERDISDFNDAEYYYNEQFKTE